MPPPQSKPKPPVTASSGRDRYSFDERGVQSKYMSMEPVLHRRLRKSVRTFFHPMYKDDEPWPQTTDVWCWHCAHPFDTMPIPGVSRCEQSKFVCFGCFCSPQCFRAYAVENRPLLWTQDVMLFSSFISNTFGIIEETKRPAPPRSLLKVFGGTLTIEEFRAEFSKPRITRLEHPRFVMERPAYVRIADDAARGVQAAPVDAATEQERLRALTADLIAEEKVKADDDRHALFTSQSPSGRAVAINDRSLFDQFAKAMQVHDGNEKDAHAAVVRHSKAIAKIGAGGRKGAAAAAAAALTAGAKGKRKKATTNKQAGKKRKVAEAPAAGAAVAAAAARDAKSL